MRFVVVICVALFSIIEAQASVPEYCAAYARDFADHVKKQDPQWQRRYDNAEKSCLFRFTSVEKPTVKEKPKAKQAVSKKTTSPPVAAASPDLYGDADPPKAEKAKVKPKLVAGSPEWKAYCKSKYVSFNEAKGTYLSKSGKERKCLVTAD